MNSNNNNSSNPPLFPGVIVRSSSPRPATPMEDSGGGGGRLPALSSRRNVLLSGRAASNIIVNPATAIGSKIEGVCQDTCGGLALPPSSCSRTPMAGIASRGRQSQTHLRAPGHSALSVSPALSDMSSIRLTPKSPGGARHAYYPYDAFKTPDGSRKSSLSRGRPGNEVDEAVMYPLHPPIQSYSPYLNSPMLTASPQALLSRKRALSISPLSELLDINSIRMSPNSLALMCGSAPGRPGSISHLIGRLSPNCVIPALPQRSLLPPTQLQTQRVSVEQAMSAGMNTVIVTSEAALQRDHTVLPWGSSQPCCLEGQMTWNSLHTSSSNMMLTSGEPEMPEDAVPMETQLCSSPSLVCQWRECGLTFEEQDDMVRHIEKVHVEPRQSQEQYVCHWDKCTRSGKPFNARYKLLIHMRTHSGEKPNKCTFPGCDKAFSRMENLRIHLRSHTGERPYPCQFAGCSKTFSNSSDRSKHQRTHYEQKPYACTYPGCAKRYTDPSSLRKHVKTHALPRKKPRNDTEPEQLQAILTVQPIHKPIKAAAKKPSLALLCDSPLDLEEVTPRGTVLHKPPAPNTDPLALYHSHQPMQEYVGYAGGQCEHIHHGPTPILLPGGPASPLSLATYDYSPQPFVHSQLHNTHFGSQYTSTPDHPPPPYTAQ